jgi:hypothetical protein
MYRPGGSHCFMCRICDDLDVVVESLSFALTTFLSTDEA